MSVNKNSDWCKQGLLTILEERDSGKTTSMTSRTMLCQTSVSVVIRKFHVQFSKIIFHFLMNLNFYDIFKLSFGSSCSLFYGNVYYILLNGLTRFIIISCYVFSVELGSDCCILWHRCSYLFMGAVRLSKGKNGQPQSGSGIKCRTTKINVEINHIIVQL